MISKRDAALAILMALIAWVPIQTMHQANQQALQEQKQLHQRDAEIQTLQRTEETQAQAIQDLKTQLQTMPKLSGRSGGIQEPPWEPFVATWYDDQGGINGTGITATGDRVHTGIVAVDPSVIPLGSEIQIKFSDGTVSPPLLADDTGSAIKGHRIDIFTWSPKEAFRNGRQAVQVRILKEATTK